MACDDGKCPEFIVNAVLKRVEVGKISRTLQTRLAFARFKVEHGLEDLPFATIEPRVQELQETKELPCHEVTSSDDSSSDEGDDLSHICQYYSVKSSGRGSAVFSDQLPALFSSSYRKRHRKFSLENRDLGTLSLKRHCSSPVISNAIPFLGQNYALSSPEMSHRIHHFTTDSGPSLPLFVNSCKKNIFYNRCIVDMDKDEDVLPLHPSEFKSSPPRTSQPCYRNVSRHHHWESIGRYEKTRRKDSGHNSHDCLSMSSPLFRKFPAPTYHPSSTSPPRTPTSPLSIISTARGTREIFSSDTIPHTPLQAFEFSDFINITPSPSGSTWPVTPQTISKRRSVEC